MFTTSAGDPTVVNAKPAHDAVNEITLTSTLVTVVPEGMPAPEILCPGPTRTSLLFKTNMLLVLVVIPGAVNRPTLDIVKIRV